MCNLLLISKDNDLYKSLSDIYNSSFSIQYIKEIPDSISKVLIHNPDVILYNTKSICNKKFVRNIKKITERIPIIMIASDIIQNNKKDIINSGIQAFISKDKVEDVEYFTKLIDSIICKYNARKSGDKCLAMAQSILGELEIVS